MVNCPAWITDCGFHNSAVLDLFVSSDASLSSTMAFPPLGNSDHVAVLVSIDFPSNSTLNAPFHHIADDYSCADWGGLHDHLRDIPWEDIFNLRASDAALLLNFVSGFRLVLKYISFIVNIMSSITHLHGFQLFVLLP